MGVMAVSVVNANRARPVGKIIGAAWMMAFAREDALLRAAQPWVAISLRL